MQKIKTAVWGGLTNSCVKKTRLAKPFKTNTPKRCPFHIGDWNAKVGSQETPAVTGKFGLGTWNEAGQRLIEFCQENSLVIANTTGGDCSHENKGRLLLGRKAMINLDSI